MRNRARTTLEALDYRLNNLKTRVRVVEHTAGSSSSTAISSLTGDVTATGPGAAAATIANDAVSNAKLANMAQATVKLREAGAGSGDPVDGDADALSTILDGAADPFLRTSAATGGSGDVTHTGALAAGQLVVGNGGDDITPGDLSGDVTTAGGTATTLAATAVTPGSYGSSTQVAVFTVDSKGRLTFAGNTTITSGGIGAADEGFAFFSGWV